MRRRPALGAVFVMLMLGLALTSALPLDGIVRNVRCFIGEFYPYEYDDEHTLFRYTVDVLTPRPLEFAFEQIELGPVEDDRCGWPSGLDSLEIHQNGALLGHWPTTCHDRETLRFGIGSLGAYVWGSSPRQPTDGSREYAPQYGSSDMLYGTVSVNDAPTRLRNITVKMFSGSKRRFMQSYTTEPRYAPLLVRVCLLDSQVPYDVVSTTYSEMPLLAPRVWPISSCVLEFPGGCVARLGFAANTNGSEPIHLHHGRSGNQLSPSRVENGWSLPSNFIGVHMPSDEPIMLAGWMCYNDGEEEVHWHLGEASILRLTAASKRCPGSAGSAAELERDFGSTVEQAAPLEKDLLRDKTYTVSYAAALRLWAANDVAQPILSLRVNDSSSG